MSPKKEFGDFQTPLSLARRVAALVGQKEQHFGTIIEPTCGVGAFLEAAAGRFGTSPKYLGFDVNPDYVEAARAALARVGLPNATVEQRDFYTIDWKQFLSEQPGPVLIIGNPPWITNAGMGVINGKNLPEKSNFQGHSGLDAITGKANFDISEWMLVKLAEAFPSRRGTLAMLVKTVVARKLLAHCWSSGVPIIEAAIYRIDAAGHFDAAVDASLVVIEFGESEPTHRAEVFNQLSRTIHPTATIAMEDGTLIADLDAYRATKHLAGVFPLRWRSGIKHDCSKVMELEFTGRQLRNGLGELLDLEPDYLLPLFKTSEVAGGRVDHCRRRMIVTQRRIGEPTAGIAERAPKTWAYLQRHRALLGKRGSSIYRGKPEFSIFGVGDYTFSPWKIAISGMYKSLRFVTVGPWNAQPVVFDDTTNFIACPSETAATLLLSLLESDQARTFYKGFIFWDAKRPITVDLLGRLNLKALAESLGACKTFVQLFGMETGKPARKIRTSAKVTATPMLGRSKQQHDKNAIPLGEYVQKVIGREKATFPVSARDHGVNDGRRRSAAVEVRRVRAEALTLTDGGLRAVYRTLELPGKHPLKDAHAALDAAVLAAYGFDAKKDLLAQLRELNLTVAAIEKGGGHVTAPGVPPSYGDAAKLVTDDYIRP